MSCLGWDSNPRHFVYTQNDCVLCKRIIIILSLSLLCVGTEVLAREYDQTKATLEANDTYIQVHSHMHVYMYMYVRYLKVPSDGCV